MHKPAKKPKSKPAPSRKESESSGAPLRIKRFRKLPWIKRPQDSTRAVMMRTHPLKVLPSLLLAPRMIACENSFGALTID
jgi:hypothetical protein